MAASHEADTAFQKFSQTIKDISPKDASRRFKEAQSHLHSSASYLPERRDIIDYKPMEFSWSECEYHLSLVGLGSPISHMSKVVKENEKVVKENEKLQQRVETLEQERNELKRKLSMMGAENPGKNSP